MGKIKSIKFWICCIRHGNLISRIVYSQTPTVTLFLRKYGNLTHFQQLHFWTFLWILRIYLENLLFKKMFMDPVSDSSLTSILVNVGVNELTSTFVYCHTDIIFRNYTVTMCWLCVFNAWKYHCSLNLDSFTQLFASFAQWYIQHCSEIMNFKSIQTMVFKSHSAFYTFGILYKMKGNNM